MTREIEFITRWRKDRAVYETWGEYISKTILSLLSDAIHPTSVGYFIKAPVQARLKDELKLVEKAFYRNKNYENPYDDITDKVGTRFVVLLGRDVRTVQAVLESVPGWTRSHDRDYEEEQNKNPIAFEYAAVHFVVRPNSDLTVGELIVPAGTPCEVQIKTILQHAYSELTHDTIYKPQIQATPSMHRNAAKSMALLEATNDYFEKVADQVSDALSSVKEITSGLTSIYKDSLGLDPSPSLLEGLLLEAYEKQAGPSLASDIRKMLEERPFLIDLIKNKVAERNPLFSQPSILLAYFDIVRRGRRALHDWPLTPDEMEPLLNHLGESRH